MEVLQNPNTFSSVPWEPLATLFWEENWTSEDVMTFFFWSSPDFGRKIGRYAVCFKNSIVD